MEVRYDQLWFLRHLDPCEGFCSSSLSNPTFWSILQRFFQSLWIQLLFRVVCVCTGLPINRRHVPLGRYIHLGCSSQRCPCCCHNCLLLFLQGCLRWKKLNQVKQQQQQQTLSCLPFPVEGVKGSYEASPWGGGEIQHKGPEAVLINQWELHVLRIMGSLSRLVDTTWTRRFIFQIN